MSLHRHFWHLKISSKEKGDVLLPVCINIQNSDYEWWSLCRDALIRSLSDLICDGIENIEMKEDGAISRIADCPDAIVAYSISKRAHYYEVIQLEAKKGNKSLPIASYNLKMWVFPPTAESSGILPIFM